MIKRLLVVMKHTAIGIAVAAFATISVEWPQLIGSYLGHIIVLIASQH
jgi:hypothetical protein